ncbi:hypothetical protein ACOMHN_002939 [Nucella lapillus]
MAARGQAKSSRGLTPSQVRQLFVVVVAVAVCFLLVELYYLRADCRLGALTGCPRTRDSSRHGEERVPEKRVQSSRQQTQSPKKEDNPQRKNRNLGNASGNKWIIADVTSGQCKGQLKAPPGWKVVRASQAQGEHSGTPMTLPADLKDVRDVWLDPQQEWVKRDAFLAVISQGAAQILETDCSLPVREVVQLMEEQTRRRHGMMYNETLLFNPYAHFGAWALAPRAALATGLWNNSQLFHVREFSRVFLRHVLSHQSPDAVLMFKSLAWAGVRFEPSSAPVYVGQGSFSPVVPGSSLYQPEAFWAMLDPCESSPPGHCRVVWRLIQQRLFRELDAFSGYYQLGGSPTQQSAPPRKREKPHSEGDSSLMNIVEFLDAWQCEAEYQFFQCFTFLLDQLQEKGYFTQEQKDAVKEFTSAIQSLGTPEPTRVKTPWRGIRKVGEFRVKLGSVRTTLEKERKEKVLTNVLVNSVPSRCRLSPSKGHYLPARQWLKPAMEDVVLVVSFNKVTYFWKNVAFLETNFRPYFKHIAYCVTNMTDIVKGDRRKILGHVTLVEGMTSYWYLMHGCATVLMQMKIPGIKGYVQIGDDTLLNPWNLFNAPHDVIYLHNFGNVINAWTHFVKPNWKWWRLPDGRCPLLKVMTDLEEVSGVSQEQLLAWAGTSAKIPARDRRHHTFTEIKGGDKRKPPPVTHCETLNGSEVWTKPTPKQAARFLHNYYKVNNMSGYFVGKTQDFFYIPEFLADDYIAMSRLFMRHQIVVELALHTILMGLAGPDHIRYIQGQSLWKADCDVPEKFFNASHFYLHPFKTNTFTLRPRLNNWYCDVYLKTLVDSLKTFRP